jgi:hypothetical protein
MACYSYSSGTPILYNNNVEIIYTASGNNYSYSSIAWLCELPVSGQLAVYTRPTSIGTETLKILNTDYTVNTSTQNIQFTSTPTGQVVIRRNTDSQKMLFKFVDGAKLTAEQLNASLHQLLFIVQEKEFAGSTFNYFNTGGIQITGGPNPVVFNLTSLTVGAGLVWNGSQFVAQSFTGNLNALTDVTIGALSTGQILTHNTGTGQWTNVLPTVDITQTNLLFADRTFYNNGGFNSYNTISTISVSGKTQLNGFKNASNKWVLTDPPTVYHILKKLTPSEQDPETFFTSIDTAITGLSANVTNAVKAKFYWDLGLERRDIVDTATGLYLSDLPTTYWDSPQELYSASGYDPTAVSGVKFYGVTATATQHRSSPYFYQVVGTSFVSKVRGYGIKSFYLSIPESSCSAFSDIPAMDPGTPTNYFTVPGTVANLNTFTNALNQVGTESEVTYRDYYLLALRDMAFAGVREMPPDANNVKKKDAISRRSKGLLITADYNGFENILFKMLENVSDLGSNCLWKIPKQIIYYNKAALAVANKDTVELTTSSTITADKQSVRFTGYSELARTKPSIASNIETTSGKYFKADVYWNDWCARWSTDSTAEDYRFNEADIDWYVRGVGIGSTSLGLYKTYSWLAPFTYNFGTTGANARSKHVIPWPFRPNDYREATSGTYDNLNFVGTQYFNIDANCLFSTATNYIPDPVDEYVYRIVTKKSLLPYFKDDVDTHLKTAIILEYGFTDHNFNAKTTALTTKADIFKKGLLRPGPNRALSLLNKNNVKVYIKNETIETMGSDTRYVITLAIQVPRLKSIGYARVFRKLLPGSVNTSYPQYNSTAADTEIDSGPWNYGDMSEDYSNYDLSSTGFWLGGDGVNTYWVNQEGTLSPFDNYYVNTSTTNYAIDNQVVSGRNECAVKFTRMGIPSNLWIRLSVLNTNGSLDLLDSSGLINNSET